MSVMIGTKNIFFMITETHKPKSMTIKRTMNNYIRTGSIWSINEIAAPFVWQFMV